jgi:hypothetical protein
MNRNEKIFLYTILLTLIFTVVFKAKEVGRACGTHGERSERWESPKERDHSEDKGVVGRMGSEWILGDWWRCVDWIRLAQDRDRWRAVVNAVMTLRVISSRS